MPKPLKIVIVLWLVIIGFHKVTAMNSIVKAQQIGVSRLIHQPDHLGYSPITSGFMHGSAYSTCFLKNENPKLSFASSKSWYDKLPFKTTLSLLYFCVRPLINYLYVTREQGEKLQERFSYLRCQTQQGNSAITTRMDMVQLSVQQTQEYIESGTEKLKEIKKNAKKVISQAIDLNAKDIEKQIEIVNTSFNELFNEAENKRNELATYLHLAREACHNNGVKLKEIEEKLNLYKNTFEETAEEIVKNLSDKLELLHKEHDKQLQEQMSAVNNQVNQINNDQSDINEQLEKQKNLIEDQKKQIAKLQQELEKVEKREKNHAEQTQTLLNILQENGSSDFSLKKFYVDSQNTSKEITKEITIDPTLLAFKKRTSPNSSLYRVAAVALSSNINGLGSKNCLVNHNS